ncbi:beta-galactosidase-1-like protein 2 [Dromiciops gliroides]|uniref:beta-galactosidase-1-like protein 2 n=1 Tax=Dromiciops gliroides TaxID=33562 RepID=UPI001CC39B96|nr:beta-galactosidase-1-like protein 2 [Dromiciops gliroides]
MWSSAGRRRDQRRKLTLLLLVVIAFLLARWFNWSNLMAIRRWNRHLGLQAEGQNFILEGNPFQILGGSIHYFRVPREYWRDRLLKLKACGLNTLTTYIPWNLHEPERGKFNFSGNLDVEAFVQMAADIGLWVILRPGPYICSEWDLGGLPSWLLQDSHMELRTTYKGFVKAVDHYFNHLIPRVVPLQYKQGGPIIAVQVENEYGSYDKDPNYMPYIKMALLNRGIVELLMTSDNKDGLSGGYLEGVLATVNLKHVDSMIFNYLHSFQENKPTMVTEYWTGWFDTWGGPHNIVDADDVVVTVSSIIQMGASLNLYMFHGGTNFGFMNGAQHFGEYRADVTSYDYDAVLTEAGDYTPKFFKLREFFSTILDNPLPHLPATQPKASYHAVKPSHYMSLWDALEHVGKPFEFEKPVNMENLSVNQGNGQSYGYILYETSIYEGGTLFSKDHIRDRAQVFVNKMYIGHMDYDIEGLPIPESQGHRKLSILVENRGRVNYGQMLNEQRKGLIGDIYLNESPLRNFKIYSLEMKENFIQRLSSIKWSQIPEEATGPAFFRGTLHVDSIVLDTFLKLEGWVKGVVFINGQNLGRFWNIGPQETLYLPGPWLHPGDNEVIVFEEQKSGMIIQSMDTPYLGRSHYID